MKSYASVLLLFGAMSCQFGEYDAPVILEKPDFQVEFFRADQSLFADDTLGLLGREPFSSNIDFTQVYVEKIMRFAPLESPMLNDQAALYTEDPIWKGVQHELDSIFSNLTEEEKLLESSLKQIAEKLPFVTVPRKVFFYNSGFNVAVYPEKEFLGIGLEWFMGNASEYVSMLPPSNYPMYKKKKMKRDNLVSDALRGFLLSSLYSPIVEENALSTMIFYGKCLFVLEQCSDLSEQEILNYTKEELNWASENENNTWKRLVAEEWLFSKDQKLMSQLTNNGPFTPGFPQDSPARLGWYTGYQMVKDFADAHQDENLKFIVDAPAEKVLKFYKP
tara:strand:- start:250854 stop:251852 length:999 start_codon:yes stop_codon:yes gene_type:complete